MFQLSVVYQSRLPQATDGNLHWQVNLWQFCELTILHDCSCEFIFADSIFVTAASQTWSFI